ncbi:NlpC/P60 family protein [Nocardioides humilatus]|uniref:NlpC/P60 family protein n=1 Tax=Nocardioides humilatus TaxID=2607660 RepID=A0A5B1LL45_9ACTN|nr:C40 family peptidase [Nocardioides humilatus]KAA1420858.1 NlpC/P60 family protein [Nocardioides humilatus]
MHTVAVRAAARLSVASTIAALATSAVFLAPTAEATAPQDGSVAPAVVRAQHQAEVRAHRAAVRRHKAHRAAVAAAHRGEQVLELASREAGDPYVYGAAGPNAFDCSGFTMFVFAQLGISLPHSSSAQAAMAQPVSDPQPGDLVFFTGGGGVYHVAIYAGDGMIWHAPHTGAVVSLEPIWTSSVFYGRVL